MIEEEIQESLRKRLVTAVTEVCRNETFYNDEMKIEGTICIISDKNSFVVFQITELVGAGGSEDAAMFDNCSNDEEGSYATYKNSQKEKENSCLNDKGRLFDLNNSDAQGTNGKGSCANEESFNQNDLNLSASFTSNPEELFDNKNNKSLVARVNNNSLFENKSFIENLSLSNTNLLKKNRKLGSFIKKRRRMMSTNNNDNDINNIANINDIINNSINNNNIQDIINNTNLATLGTNSIKQELPDFEYENTENLTIINNLNNNHNNNNNNSNKLLLNIDLNNKQQDSFCEFSSRCYEEIHIRTSHGIYRYLCKLCNSMFKIRNGLFEHLNGHFGRRPHACRQCDARFAHHSSLHNHVRNKHSQQTEEEKLASLRHVCCSCGRRFRYPSELERHKAVHEEFSSVKMTPSPVQTSRLLNASKNALEPLSLLDPYAPPLHPPSSQHHLQSLSHRATTAASNPHQPHHPLPPPPSNFELQIFDNLTSMGGLADSIDERAMVDEGGMEEGGIGVDEGGDGEGLQGGSKEMIEAGAVADGVCDGGGGCGGGSYGGDGDGVDREMKDGE